MNICIINGSHRKGGNCHLFSEMAKKVLEEKHSVTLFNLLDYNIVPCNGCLICEEGMECPITDIYAETICPVLKTSDLIVFASPTYFNMPSALMINFLDRTNNLCDFFAENKKNVITYLVGQTDVETINDAYKCMRTYYEIMGMEESIEPIICVARMPEKVDKEIVEKLKNF